VAHRLLERDAQLAALSNAIRRAGNGAGSVVLIHGEAGIGKSSLIGALPSLGPTGARFLVGHCDALITPRTLGPFRDLTAVVGDRLAAALSAGDRDRVADALLVELARERPTILAIEDVHWADEATMDALRFLSRRVSQLPAVLVLTYRDDELVRDHPLSQLLGDASNSGEVLRLNLPRLSAAAVGVLVAESALDPDEIFSMTAGNPYFVSEMVASADGSMVPPTVVDAVLGRLRRLHTASQEAIELLAVVPSALNRKLIDALLRPNQAAAVSEAEERGLLTVRPDQVTFRHELTRRAIADSLTVARRIELNREVLAVLEELGDSDAARLVHHASQAGDVDAVVQYAPVAARDAATSGAHREAAAHFALALAHGTRYDSTERARLFEEFAIECYTVGAGKEAVDAQRRAVALRRDLPDRRALGLSLRWLSRMLWLYGQRAEAEHAGVDATNVLTEVGDPGLIAFALSNQSQLAMLAHRVDEGAELARRAISLADKAGAQPVLSHALANLGSSRWMGGDRGGLDDLLEAIRVAREINDVEDACRAYANIIWLLLDDYRLDEAESHLSEALALAERAEFLGFLAYLRASQGRLLLARGKWADAVAAVDVPPRTHPPARCVALTVIAAARIRQGQEGATESLDEAWQLATDMDELQRIGPVAAVRSEQAALATQWDLVTAIAQPIFDDAVRLGDLPLQAELGYRLRQAGREVMVPGIEHPYALQARGDWQAAAAAWQQAGCPYHEAAALAESPHPADLLHAVSLLDALDAAPLARQVRARLRELGVTGVPRGPTSAAQANPAGLTDRQLEVLRMLADGHTNAEIAGQLVVSVRTVDRHVAEVFAKLAVNSRRQAAARAHEMGINQLDS
jgi:DNA-binding CsgD family transcriptional regulator/tetratricopeptide (TPR) repeat protein